MPTVPPSATTIVLDPTAWIAYQTCPACNDSDGQIWVSHPDGSADHRISPAQFVEADHPDLSHDGNQIAFDAGGAGSGISQIYVAGVHGANLRQLGTCTPPGCYGYSHPAWSPDGTRIAIARDFGPVQNGIPSAFGIEILDLATGHRTEVTQKHPLSVGQDVSPRWSPDGRSLVFWRDRVVADGSEDTAIFIVGSDGTNVHQITPWNEEAGSADWSSDGEMIVYGTHPFFTSPTPVASELVTIHPGGSGRTALTDFGVGGAQGFQPRWTPDGGAIVYTRQTDHQPPEFVGQVDRHIWVIAADGTSDTPVLTTRQIYANPVLEP